MGAQPRQLRRRHLVVVVHLRAQDAGRNGDSDRQAETPQRLALGTSPSEPCQGGKDREAGLTEGMNESKVATTIRMPRTLKLRAESAVLTTSGRSGGYDSFASLVSGAISHELFRLATDLNEGRPFAPNAGPFRIGRPAGRG